jgi:uncharacterized protein (DUF433 family)
MKNYVEFRDGGYWIAGSRVSLDSIVYCFRDGQSPEGIAENFPVLSLEQVYGAIAFYLSNRKDIDEYLIKAEEEGKKISREINDKLRQNNPSLYEKLRAAKKEIEPLF